MTRRRRRRIAVLKSLMQFQTVQGFIYYTAMISTSGILTYMIYLYTGGTI